MLQPVDYYFASNSGRGTWLAAPEDRPHDGWICDNISLAPAEVMFDYDLDHSGNGDYDIPDEDDGWDVPPAVEGSEWDTWDEEEDEDG